jgi:hypothetical protein
MKELITELEYRNALLFWFGAINFFCTLLCAFLCFTSSKTVMNVSAWLKPLKFFLSLGIFCWTILWYLYYLNEPKIVEQYSYATILIMSFEVTYITIKAGREQLSHFNTSSAFNGIMFSLMGIAISVFTIWTGYIGYLFFIKTFPELPIAYVWGIRSGILFFVVFAFEGGVMGAKLSHTVGAKDGSKGLPLTNWSKQHGDLRIAHFIGMHALQIIPLFAFYVAKNKEQVVVIAFIYFIITSLLFIQAMLGKPLFKFKSYKDFNK